MEIQLQVMNERKFRCPFNHVFQDDLLAIGRAFLWRGLHTTLTYFIVTSLKGRRRKFAFQKLLSMYF